MRIDSKGEVEQTVTYYGLKNFAHAELKRSLHTVTVAPKEHYMYLGGAFLQMDLK